MNNRVDGRRPIVAENNHAMRGYIGLCLLRSLAMQKNRVEVDLICTELVMYPNCPPLCTEIGTFH